MTASERWTELTQPASSRQWRHINPQLLSVGLEFGTRHLKLLAIDLGRLARAQFEVQQCFVLGEVARKHDNWHLPKEIPARVAPGNVASQSDEL